MKRTIRQCAGVLAMTCLAAIPALSAPGATIAATAVDWPTYGFDSLRTGNNTAETALSPATVSKLKLAWAFSHIRYFTLR